MDSFSSSFLSRSLSPPSTTWRLRSPSPSSSPRPLQIYSLPTTQDKTDTARKPPPTATSTRPSPPPTKTTNRRSIRPFLPQQLSIPSLMFNAVDDFINAFVDPPNKPATDPRFVLSGNFSPVDELPPTECHVIHGSLPPCLDGAYIRNGPNPQYLPRGPYHLFDGDGMLHALTISRGRATLSSRYVKTYKYVTERDAGAPLLPNVFSGFNGLTASAARGALSAARIATGMFNPANGIGLANTSLAFFGDRLFALGESDLPYSVRLTEGGDVETLNRHDFDGKLVMSMTAHPKTDLQTGETFAFRYGPMPPFLTYFRFDADGNKQPDVPIFSMVSPSFLHDFAITQKYALFAEIQIGMNPMDMVFGGGSPVGADPKKVPRVGIIPRYATDESHIKY